MEKNIDMPKLISQLETYLSSLPQDTDIEKYVSHYPFTQTEKILFEKYTLKYITLSAE